MAAMMGTATSRSIWAPVVYGVERLGATAF
nr:MAG TPA: hypothetical protein [Caudoviricetes sp.]